MEHRLHSALSDERKKQVSSQTIWKSREIFSFKIIQKNKKLLSKFKSLIFVFFLTSRRERTKEGISAQPDCFRSHYYLEEKLNVK